MILNSFYAKRLMKVALFAGSCIILFAGSCIILFGISGCGGSKIINQTEGSEMRKVASNGLGDIYVINIDGEDYVVILGSYKAAICPKMK